jgi:hypothetical protein
MLTKHRPVTGADLLELQDQLQLSTNDIRWVLGLSSNRWCFLTHPDNIHHPVKNISLALLARFYSQNPDRCPVNAAPDADELRTTVKVNLKTLAVLLGKEPVSAHRWIKQGGKMSPPVARLAKHLSDVSSTGNIKDWYELLNQEANSRGLGDVLETGSWSSFSDNIRKNQP